MNGSSGRPRRPTDEELSAWLDGELDPLRREEVEAALAEEPELRERVERLAAVDEALASRPVPPVSERLAARMRERLREERRAEGLRRTRGDAPRRRRRAGRRMAAGLAAAAAAVFALVLLTRGPAPVPPPGAPGEVVAEGGAPEELEALAGLDPDRLVEALEEEGVSPEEMAIALDLDTLEDLPVIEQLELLEKLARLEAEGEWS